jgi:ribonuclease III family protein
MVARLMTDFDPETPQPALSAIATVPIRALAFLGDAVFSLRVREWLLQHHSQLPQGQLHTLFAKLTCAQAQADLLQTTLMPLLTLEEDQWLKQGRNANVTVARRNQQKTYRLATACEVLLGVWHLQQPQRLQALWPVIAQWLTQYSTTDKPL